MNFARAALPPYGLTAGPMYSTVLWFADHIYEGPARPGHCSGAPDHGRTTLARTTLPASRRAIIPADHGQFQCRRYCHERRRAIPRAAPILLAVAHSRRRAFVGHARHIPILAGDRYTPISLVKYRNRRRGTRI